MLIGHGTATLPVIAGEPMGGYEDRRPIGVDVVLDPLQVHTIVFDSGDQSVALVVADLVCVNVDVVDMVKSDLRRRLGISHICVAATHTHASPESGCRPGGGATDASIAARLRAAALESAGSALDAKVPSALTVARALVPDLASIRTPGDGGPMDIPVDVILVRQHERIAGALVVCPVHPTVLGSENCAASADLNGSIRRAVAEQAPRGVRGGPPWVVAATGAAGDISTRFHRRARTPHEAQRLGGLVAESLWKALPGRVSAGEADGVSGTGIDHAETIVTLPRKELPDLAGLEAALPPMGTRSSWVFHQGLEIANRLRARPAAREHPVRIEAFRMGDVTLIVIPGELFLDLGEWIRRHAPRPDLTLVLGYANGYLGYLPPRDAPMGYEVLVSPVAAGSGERVAEAAVALARAVQPRTERLDTHG